MPRLRMLTTLALSALAITATASALMADGLPEHTVRAEITGGPDNASAEGYERDYAFASLLIDGQSEHLAPQSTVTVWQPDWLDVTQPGVTNNWGPAPASGLQVTPAMNNPSPI